MSEWQCHLLISYAWIDTLFNNIHKGNAIRSLLKDSYLGPRCVLDVLVDGKDEHEGEEDPDAAKEVPDVVPDVNKGFNTLDWDLTHKRVGEPDLPDINKV